MTVETLPDKTHQPFYKSSGHSSGCAGTWFPFDGWKPTWNPNGWFDKSRFVSDRPDSPVPQQLHRYGTDEFKDISRRMTRRKIDVVLSTSDPVELNEWIGTPKTIGYASQWRVIRS